MKTMWKLLKSSIMVHRNKKIWNKITLLTCIFLIFPFDIAHSKNVIDEKKALNILRHSYFGNAITKLTRLFPVYHDKSQYLFHYVSTGWQADHTNEGLVVFIDNKYHHDYYMNQTCTFNVVGKHLICHFPDFPGEVETNLLSDVFAGKKIVIGGSEEALPRRGSKKLYR